MSRTGLSLSITIVLSLVACESAEQRASSLADIRPNFLVIFTDDMGFTDLGAFGGGDIGTPNLDELAFNGIRFSNFHGHLSCAPSRALLLSGTGNHEAGLGTQVDLASFRGQRNYERYLVDRVATLPEILRSGGYRTYLSGKWGLAGPTDLDPTERGFEHAFALLPSGGGHLESIIHDNRYSRDGIVLVESDSPVYSTTLFTDALIEFIESDQDNELPFFAMFTPTAPHWPLHFPPGMQDAYAGKYDSGYDALRQRRITAAKSVGVLPASADEAGYASEAAGWDSLSDEDKALNTRVMEIYAAMVAHLDSEIGRLLARLEAVGALENTLILFINDNGAQGGQIFGGPRSYMQGRSFDNRFENLGAGSSWANVGQGWAEASTAPFRDSKASAYEGALRVAAFAHWPGVIPADGMSEQFLNNMDVMPTVLELAGLTHPAPMFDGREIESMRGKSFAGLLRGDDSAVHEPGEAIALSSAGRHFMYRGNWKLLKELNSDWELYNLSRDPYERNNLAGERPELLQELMAQFEVQADLSNILER